MTPARIDLHQHFFPAGGFGADLLRQVDDDTGWRLPPENFPWSPEKNLRFMDQLGIETSILSLTGSPGGDGVSVANREFALFGSDFPAVDLATAAWYTRNVDAHFADHPQQLEDVMRSNALALFPRLRTHA